VLLFSIITHKRKVNTITVHITAVCLCNLHCYMFRQFPVTIRQFTANALLRVTHIIQIAAFGNTVYKILLFSLISIRSVLQLDSKGICEVPTNGTSTIKNILVFL